MISGFGFRVSRFRVRAGLGFRAARVSGFRAVGVQRSGLGPPRALWV